MPRPRVHAYLHGFASGPAAYKGGVLRERYREHGARLHVPDLNAPDFAHLTYAGSLAVIDELDARHGHDAQWCFVGSSMGGYLAARWAELHPERVAAMLLLCPGFDLVNRWESMLGAQAMRTWESEGSLPFPDARGEVVAVHWRFVEEAREHPTQPRVPCPTTIVHGRNDVVVPIEGSRAYAADHADRVDLVEVDDDHGLAASLDPIWELARRRLLESS